MFPEIIWKHSWVSSKCFKLRIGVKSVENIAKMQIFQVAVKLCDQPQENLPLCRRSTTETAPAPFQFLLFFVFLRFNLFCSLFFSVSISSALCISPFQILLLFVFLRFNFFCSLFFSVSISRQSLKGLPTVQRTLHHFVNKPSRERNFLGFLSLKTSQKPSAPKFSHDTSDLTHNILKRQIKDCAKGLVPLNQGPLVGEKTRKKSIQRNGKV